MLAAKDRAWVCEAEGTGMCRGVAGAPAHSSSGGAARVALGGDTGIPTQSWAMAPLELSCRLLLGFHDCHSMLRCSAAFLGLWPLHTRGGRGGVLGTKGAEEKSNV